MKKKAAVLKKPPGLTRAERATLSRILKKARAAKAWLRQQTVPSKKRA